MLEYEGSDVQEGLKGTERLSRMSTVVESCHTISVLASHAEVQGDAESEDLTSVRDAPQVFAWCHVGPFHICNRLGYHIKKR